MKMKFKADGYLKKPVDKSDLSEIIKKSIGSDSNLIASDLTLKDILDDDDILDLGSTVVEEREPEMDSGDILIENLPFEEVSNDPETKEEIKIISEGSLDNVPDLDDSSEPDDSPFQIDDEDEPDITLKIDKLKKEFSKKEEDFDKEKKKLLRELETSELKLEEKEKEKENFKNKLSGISEDYEKKMEDVQLKYKNKLDKFANLLKKSIDEINED